MSIVRMSWPGSGCFGAVMAGMLLGGCGPKPPSTERLPQPPPTQPANSIWNDQASGRRLRDLEREANNLAEDTRQLPGRDGTDHSRIVQRVLTDLLQTLPLLQNPVNDRVLAQRLSIIQNSRAQLAAGSSGLAIEPAIDTALRAASAALADISHGDNFEQANMGLLLDTLSADINHLDLVRDSNLHRLDVANVAGLMSQAISKMAAALGGRLTAEAQPGGTPTSQPTSGPAPK